MGDRRPLRPARRAWVLFCPPTCGGTVGRFGRRGGRGFFFVPPLVGGPSAALGRRGGRERSELVGRPAAWLAARTWSRRASFVGAPLALEDSGGPPVNAGTKGDQRTSGPGSGTKDPCEKLHKWRCSLYQAVRHRNETEAHDDCHHRARGITPGTTRLFDNAVIVFCSRSISRWNIISRCCAVYRKA